MGWERRRNKLYYYKKTRINGKVSSIYHGCGEIAQSLAELDKLTKLSRQSNRLKQSSLAQNLTELEEMTKELDTHSELINILIEALLLATNHHNHKGEWRKQRDNNKLKR